MNAIDLNVTAGNRQLFGTLHLPEKQDPPLVVGSHGLEGSRESAKQQVLARLLPENGIAFFRFDHRGCGQSQGDFVTDTSLDKRRQDLVAAVTTVMNTKKTRSDLGLFGSSMGGATCIHAWQAIEAAGFPPKGAVLCASPVISSTIKKIPTQANDGRPALPLSFFAENLLFDLTPSAPALHHVLIFHGDADEVVPVSNARLLHQTAGDPKELVIHSSGSHRMDLPAHQKDFEKRALAWFKQMFYPAP
jgi:alpha-beta hydrolase superfamily lysophospholipase